MIYDWLVVGGGITGALLAYELAKQGLSVLMIERDAEPAGATRYSYGGLAYWSGKTPLLQDCCAAGINYYRHLTAELGTAIGFREFPLLLTIEPGQDPTAIHASYQDCAIVPQLLTVTEACQREPLLNPAAIGAALEVPHAQIDPVLTLRALGASLTQRGGTVKQAQVERLLRQGERVQGVQTNRGTVQATHTVICAGGMGRSLLAKEGIGVRLYYSHAEILETQPVEFRLRGAVMPAVLNRFRLEAIASQAQTDALWQEQGHTLAPAILDVGVFQCAQGQLRIGQITRAVSGEAPPVDATQSEAALRQAIGYLFPVMESLPATWHHCLVAFTPDGLPLMGAIPGTEGLHLFSGFSNPLVSIPVFAQWFAQAAIGSGDPTLQAIMAQIAVDRFNRP